MSNNVGSNGQGPNWGYLAAGLAASAVANPNSLAGALQSLGTQAYPGASSSSGSAGTSMQARQRYSNPFASPRDRQNFLTDARTQSTLLGHSVNRHTNRDLTGYFSGTDNRRDDPSLALRNQMGIWQNGGTARSTLERTVNTYGSLIQDWRANSTDQDLVIDSANPRDVGASYRRTSRATPTNDATYTGGPTSHTRTVFKRDPSSPTGFRLASHYPIRNDGPTTPVNQSYSQITGGNQIHRRRLDDADDEAEMDTETEGGADAAAKSDASAGGQAEPQASDQPAPTQSQFVGSA